MADPTSTRLTASAFLDRQWPPHSELVDGEVVVTDPTLWHQVLGSRVLFALQLWTGGGTGRGLAAFGGNWVLGDDQVFKPDAWWYSAERPLDIHALWIESPPDLAVEVRSPTTWWIDTGRKRQVYEESGVREYWLVDTPRGVITALRRSTSQAALFDVTVEFGAGHVVTTPLLPEFALSIDELFAPPQP